MSGLIEGGEYGPLPARGGISEKTCRLFDYKKLPDYKGQPVQIATYYTPDGKPCAQKIRFPDKTFQIVGDIKQAGLYGQHKWRDKGKKVTITEGEIDALTASHIDGDKWPVVSVLNGAQGAKRDLKKNLDWLLGFDEIILMFDDDEPGRAAVEECAPLFPPGRCKVARIEGFKDANEALKARQPSAIRDAIFSAKGLRPDGILSGNDLWQSHLEDCTAASVSVSYPWDGVEKATLGLRSSELVMITAGSGIGKSAIVRELAYHLLTNGESVGMLMLEESIGRSVKGLIGIHMNRPVHLDMTPWLDLTKEEQATRRTAFEAVGGNSRLHLYDHFGSTDGDNLINRIRFMVQGLGCRWIILDHLSIVVSGMDDGDERKTIDVLMTKLRTLVQETKCGMIVVSHLKRPSGDKGHEQGAEVSLSQLRGSHSIAQLSDCVIGAERNQQSEETKNITTLRILKNRFTGETGIATNLMFDRPTGRLREITPESIFEAASAAKRGESFNPDNPEF